MDLINELMDGQHVFSQYLVSSSNKCVNTKGKNYLNITLQDRTGEIAAKKWEVYPEDLSIFTPGNIVSVEGEVLSYNGSLQLKIISGETINRDGMDTSRFVPNSPVSIDTLKQELGAFVTSIKNEQIRTLTEYLIKKFKNRYLEYPAATRNHHNYLHGLLFHSLSMAKDADALAKLYPSLNRDLLIAGTLLHDIGKTIELSGPVATNYTTEGKLLGHISIMQAEIRMAAKELGMLNENDEEEEIPMLLEHMVLSHHGQPDYGSPVKPMTREAIALSMIDDFDAKMVMIDKALETIEPGTFTPKLFAFEDISLYRSTFDKKKD